MQENSSPRAATGSTITSKGRSRPVSSSRCLWPRCPCTRRPFVKVTKCNSEAARSHKDLQMGPLHPPTAENTMLVNVFWSDLSIFGFAKKNFFFKIFSKKFFFGDQILSKIFSKPDLENGVFELLVPILNHFHTHMIKNAPMVDFNGPLWESLVSVFPSLVKTGPLKATKGGPIVGNCVVQSNFCCKHRSSISKTLLQSQFAARERPQGQR